MPAPAEQTRRTVYFLGAGASAAVSRHVVVTVNLLEHAIDASHGGSPEDLEIATNFVRFLAREGSIPRIDDVLSVVDSALFDNLDLSEDWSVRRLADVRLALNKL